MQAIADTSVYDLTLCVPEYLVFMCIAYMYIIPRQEHTDVVQSMPTCWLLPALLNNPYVTVRSAICDVCYLLQCQFG